MEAIVTIDLHGRNVYQGRVAIDAALRRARPGTMRIRVIHGHNSGSALKDMVRGEYARHPKVLLLETRLGEGVTDLVLR